MKNLRRNVLATILAVSLTAVFGWAQEAPPAPADYPADQQQVPPPPAGARPDQGAGRADAPDRAARLQYIQGSVSIQPQGTGDWVTGTQNSTLTNSDNVWTDKESKAELNVGGGLLRMGDESSLTLTNISSQNVQVELHQGTLNLHVHHLFGGEIYEVDTPNMAFTVQKSGDYRFDVDPNGDSTVVTVRKGEGDATGGGPAVRIKSNEQARFTNGTSLEHTSAEAPPFDGFDSWCGARNDREDHSLSAQYVAPGVIGYEDLDANGTWSEVPPYGHIWVPRVAVGWSPYSAGHWAYVAPWGWTWVDDAPWGYAPFHYGRWVYTGGYWGWAPGPVYVRPYYAPALVAWFGGPGWGVSFGFGFGGGFGWCPLGWGEPFFPWYHYGFGYFRGVNISNTYIHNVNNFYGHPPMRGSNFANYNHGFMGAPSRTLQNGLSVARTGMHLNGSQAGNAPFAHGPGVSPSRGAMGAVARGPASGSFSHAVETRNGMTSTARGGMNTMASNRTEGGFASHSVPRPPSAAGREGTGFTQSPSRGNATLGNAQHSVAQPSTNMARSSTPYFGASRSTPPTSASGSSAGRSTSVPRPTGPVRPASAVSRSGGSYSGGSTGGRSYGSGSYGSSRYSGASPSYRGGSYGSMSSPRYSSAPSSHSYSAPSSRGYSAPSSRGYSAPSYHGGGSSPSYHGGGGGGSSHGGGYSGGGHSGGGGGHSGGGHR